MCLKLDHVSFLSCTVYTCRMHVYVCFPFSSYKHVMALTCASKIVLLELLETTISLSQKVLNNTSSISFTFICYVGHVGSDVVVTEECVIGASCSVDGTESLPRRTIICGSNNQRYTLAQPPSVSLDVL